MKKFALLGASHIHTPGFSEIMGARSDVEVVAVWDPDPAISQKYADKFHCRSMSEVSSLLNIPDLDAVVVLSQTNLHQSLVLQTAEAKKHCFVEKPLAMGLADGKKMKQALEEANVIFQTGYFKRYLPEHRFLRQLMKECRFGKISRVRLDFGTTAIFNDIFHSDWLWMTDPARAGVGAFGDLGTHLLDLLLYLMDDLAELEAVTAVFTRPLKKYPDCEECGEALLRFDNGTLASIAAGWLDWVEPTSLIISGTGGHAQIRGTAGTPHHDTQNDLFLLIKDMPGADGKQPWTDLPEVMPSPLDLFMNAVVRNHTEPLISVREAANRSYVMEAINKAAAEQRWVSIDPRTL